MLFSVDQTNLHLVMLKVVNYLSRTRVILTVVKLKIDKQRPGGASSPFLNKAIYDCSKYGMFKSVNKN